MTSQIDPTHPETGYAYTQNVRDNFETAANEITALQDAVTSLQTLLAEAQADIVNLKARQMAAVDTVTLNPPNTSSIAFVTAGIGVTLTTASGSRAFFMVDGGLGNTANSAASDLELVYGEGPAPASGTPVTATNGTVVGNPVNMLSARSGDVDPFGASALLTGLVPGTAYWLDVGYRAESGTATLSAMSITAFELLDPIS